MIDSQSRASKIQRLELKDRCVARMWWRYFDFNLNVLAYLTTVPNNNWIQNMALAREDKFVLGG
jgi:hypothetical protein